MCPNTPVPPSLKMGVTLGQALLNFVITADDIQAPWEWPTWQLLTKSIFAPWTLPTEVKDYAPPSAAWTADTPAQVRAFVDNYIGMEDEKARLAFWVKKEDGNSKGRAAYKDWIGRESRKWGINKAVDQILRDAGCSQWQMTRRTVDKATKAVSYTVSQHFLELICSLLKIWNSCYRWRKRKQRNALQLR